LTFHTRFSYLKNKERKTGKGEKMDNTVVVSGERAVATQGPQALIDAWLGGRRETTHRAYQGDLDTFRAFLGMDTPEKAVGAFLALAPGPANAWALAWKNQMVERGLSPATVNRRLAALRSVTKLARTIMGLVSWGLDVENVKAEAYRDTRGPGVDRFRAMLDRVGRRNDAKGRRDAAILRCLFDLALRAGEVVGLDRADVDLEQGCLLVLGKGRTQKETLSLPGATRDALRGWIATRGEQPGPLFTRCTRAKGDSGRLTARGLHKLVKRLGADLGFVVRPHGLRHSAITEAVKLAEGADVDLSEVTQYSRHRDVRTLMIYRDRERNVQGRLARLVSASAE